MTDGTTGEVDAAGGDPFEGLAHSPSRLRLVAALTLLVTVGAIAVVFVLTVDEDDDPELARTTSDLTIDFDAPDGTPLADLQPPWEDLRGRFATEDGRAVVATPNPDGPRSLTRLSTGSADATVSVEARGVAEGWALAFRVDGPLDYFAVVARPGRGSWSVERVLDGEVQELPDVILAPPRDGDVVSIEQAGSVVTVRIGDEEGSVDDPALAGRAFIGLLAVESDGRPAWAGLTIRTDGPPTIPAVTVPRD